MIKLSQIKSSILKQKNFHKTVLKKMDKNPFLSFLGLLGMLFFLVVVGNFLRKPPTATALPPKPTKEVKVYQVGENPRMEVQGKIEKTGVTTIIAQSAGVVQKINIKEGGKIKKGTTIVSLSTNYQGGNASGVTRQIAQTNVDFLTQNYDSQKDIIAKQKDIAGSSDAQADKLREINRQSVDDTKNLIRLDEEIVSQLTSQIDYLVSTNVSGSNDSAILSAKQGKAQILAALNSLKSGLRSIEYVNSDDNDPAKLGNLQKDVLIKQLELQEKTLDLNKEMAQLNLKLANISASLMYPASPFAGVVERVFVKVGQSVSPGTPIASIKGNNSDAMVVALVAKDIATSFSKTQPSYAYVNDQKVELTLRYVSQEPTEGTLHSIIFDFPAEYVSKLANNNSLTVEIPIGVTATTVSPFIPIDAIYQTENQAFVHVVGVDGNGKTVAQVKQVQIGQVYDQYVEVLSGLVGNNQIILDRSVIDGEEISLKK